LIENVTLFERVGGTEFFTKLVEAFYQGVENDPILRPMYPSDLSPGKTRLRDFLIEYWGGPATYTSQRGHPRLRMRHSKFPIDIASKNAWLEHMESSVRSSIAAESDKLLLLEHFRSAGNMLINKPATLGVISESDDDRSDDSDT